jgi:hypothetical protein
VAITDPVGTSINRISFVVPAAQFLQLATRNLVVNDVALPQSRTIGEYLEKVIVAVHWGAPSRPASPHREPLAVVDPITVRPLVVIFQIW